jgi:integrase
MSDSDTTRVEAGATQTSEATRYPGIAKIHARGCGWRERRCACTPSWQAAVWSAREGKRIRKHFEHEGEARTWREDSAGALREGRMRAPTATTVKQAADALVAGMEDGSILDRSGAPYKPSTIRSYATSLRLRVEPAIGHRRISTLVRADVQALVDRWRKDGLSASTVQNQLNPLQVIVRRAIEDGEVTVDPTKRLRLPAIRGKRDRVADPAEAARLIEILPSFERAVWATAMYAGLRHGELRALRWSDVDFEAGEIYVERSWDALAGPVDVKTKAGRRSVPLIGPLRTILAAHKLASGRIADALVFGRTAELAFTPSAIYKHARKAWKAAKVDGIGLHECRHTFASFAIAAGLNIKQVSTYMGHADVKITLNTYGHLFGDDPEQAAVKLDEYLAAAVARQG